MKIDCVLENSAKVPQMATTGSACVDLYAYENGIVNPNNICLVDTGVKIAIPEGHVGLVCSRSGLSLKHQVFVLNSPGVIDSDYRGPLKVILFNASKIPFTFNEGERIAQLMIVKYEIPQFNIVNELSDSTERGAGGFGSTGIQ